MLLESHCDFLNKNADEPCWGVIHLVKHVIIETEEFFNEYDIWCCEGHKECFNSKIRSYVKQNE